MYKYMYKYMYIYNVYIYIYYFKFHVFILRSLGEYRCYTYFTDDMLTRLP